MKPIKLLRETDVLGQEKPQASSPKNNKGTKMGLYVFALIVVAALLIILLG